MNIGTRVILIFLAILGLLSAVVVSMSLLTNSRQQTAAAEIRRFQSIKLADQIRQSSDDLTRMARTYVVTGDATYEQYFYEILAIRDGISPRPKNYDEIYWDFVTATKETSTNTGTPVALAGLMKQVAITSQEMAKLEEAKNNSDQLTGLEITAFGAMKGLFADDTGKLSIHRNPDPAFARKILHGEQYHKAKAEIVRPIGEFLKLLDQRTLLEIKVNRAEVDRYQIITIVLVGVAILFSIFAFFHIRGEIIAPIVSLSTTAMRIQSGMMDERAGTTSSDEVGTLAGAFNKMVESLQLQITERKRADLNRKESEQRFRDFAESSADWMWETDEEGRFSFVSEGIVHATSGLQVKGILGMKRADFVEEDMQLYPEKWKKHLADMDAHQLIKNFEYSIMTPKGGLREFIINGKPFFDADGTFKGYRGVASDFTHIKKSREELSIARKRAVNIIEMAPFAIVTVDQQLNIISFNRSAEETFGYARDEALGKNLHILLPSDMAEKHNELIRKFFENNLEIQRMDKHGDIKGLRKNGEVFIAEGSVSKQKTEIGVVFTAMLTDVTERKHTEEELEHHRKHLEEQVAQRTNEVEEKALQLEAALEREKEYNALQKKFVALVSHEFRTPLTIIDGTAQRLIRNKNKLDADEIETRADKVRSAVARMVGLIDTTLYASQMDDGKIEMKYTLGDIRELILDVCERQAEISPDHQCNVDVEKLPKEMWFDPNLLDHVFSNILSNAVKYSPQAPHIEVKGWQENEATTISVITVTDHGVGIPEDDLPHMFRRFFRASTAEGIKGTGLGMSVCKDFVELHGGSIGVTSEEGEGTTFTVRLPIGDRDQ